MANGDGVDIPLTGDSSDLEEALRRAIGALEGLSDAIRGVRQESQEAKEEQEKVAKSADSLGKAWKATAAGALAAVAAYGKLVHQVTSTRREILQLTEATGFHQKTLSGLRLAAQRAGKDLGQVVPDDFAERMLDAARGSADAAEAFGDLGIEVTDGSGRLRDQDEVLTEVLDKLQGMSNRGEAAALAQQLMSDRGAELMAVLGDERLGTFIGQAERLGLDVGPEAAASTERLTEAVGDLQLAAEVAGATLVDSLGDRLAPVIDRAAVTLVTLAESFTTFVERTAEDHVRLLVNPLLAFENLGQAWEAGVDQAIAFEGAIRDVGDQADLTGEQMAELLGLDGSGGLRSVTEDSAAAAREQRGLEQALRDAARRAAEQASALQQLSDVARDFAARRLDEEGQILVALEQELERLDELAAKAGATAEAVAQAEEAKADAIAHAEERISEVRSRREEEEEERLAREEERREREAAAFDKMVERMLRDLERAGQVLEREAQQQREAQQAVQDVVISSIGTLTSALQAQVAEGSAAAQALFVVQQAAAIAQVIVDTQRAAMLALATVPPPGGPALATAYEVQGGIAAGIIAATTIGSLSAGGGEGVSRGIAETASSPPSFHTGVDPDELVAVLRRGEGVLNPSGVAAVGGADAVRAANRGEAPAAGGGSGPIVFRWRNDVFELARDRMGMPGSVIREIRRDGRRVGHAKRRRSGKLVL